jgi:hypothetical protein
MSYAETQQIMADLKEIMALIDGVTIKTEKLNTNLPRTKETLSTFRDIERVALRYLALSRRMGLPEDIEKATQTLTELIVMIRMAQMSYTMLTAGTPIGLLLGAAGIAMTALSASDFVMNPGG